jgi:hypothetical protein
MNKNDENDDQEKILNYKPLDFKDTDIITFTLKINSKDRNYIREPNPFNFEIVFNQNQMNNNSKAVITSKFEKIKRITLCQVCIPRYIPRDYMGEPVTGITPVYNDANSVSLSFYPGININNNVIYVLDNNNNEIKIEVLELVDIANKKLYLVALQYNNPFHVSKYINMKAELFSYLNINNFIYPITNITGNIITLDNTENYPLPMTTNFRLIIGDFYKNSVMIDNNGSKIGININTIQIIKANILNFQYLFSGQFLEYQINLGNTNNIYERKLFKITSLTTSLIDSNLSSSINNTIVIINGIWVQGLPSTFNVSPIFFDRNNTIRLNQFNFGVRDLFDEKIFYINLSPFTPSKDVSTDPTINKSFGVLYPFTPNSTKDFLYLKGDAAETYTNVNLQNTSNKMRFSLMDSNNQLIGTIYNKYQNLYYPTNNIPLTSYLPFLPDVNIILKLEEVDKKFNNIG